MKRSLRIRIGVVSLAALAGLAGIAAPALAGQSHLTVTQTINAGSLTAVASDLTMPVATYSHASQDNTGTLSLSVDDSTGSGAGWAVTIRSTELAHHGGDGPTDIQAVRFAVTSAATPVKVAGQDVDSTNGPKASGAGSLGTLDSERTVISAAAGYGQGSYTQDLDLTLSIPAYARAGTYTGALLISVNAAP